MQESNFEGERRSHLFLIDGWEMLCSTSLLSWNEKRERTRLLEPTQGSLPTAVIDTYQR
jgi:hypothetical protein